MTRIKSEEQVEVNCGLTIHDAKTRDCDHDGEEDATQGAKEGATKVQSDGTAPSNGILRRELGLVLCEKAITHPLSRIAKLATLAKENSVYIGIFSISSYNHCRDVIHTITRNALKWMTLGRFFCGFFISPPT